MARRALLLLWLAAALASVGEANLCYPTHSSSGTNLSQLSDLHACKGAGKWSKLSAIWTPLRIHITCSTPDVSPPGSLNRAPAPTALCLRGGDGPAAPAACTALR
jgi:hypothetical protein